MEIGSKPGIPECDDVVVGEECSLERRYCLGEPRRVLLCMDIRPRSHLLQMWGKEKTSFLNKQFYFH